MKSSITIKICLLALSSGMTGCVGTGPNTQQGAALGGAIGAVAGAVMGHNSRGADALGGAILGGTAGALAGGAIGNSVDHENGTVYGYPERRRRSRVVVVESAPPPAPAPIPESIPPSPASAAIWIPGYWAYNGNGYGWMSGHWESPPPLARQYVSAHWERRGDTFVFVNSYWQ